MSARNHHAPVSIRHIGKSADDLRFFIAAGSAHAGGVTVHSAGGGAFSYGVAVSPQMRRRGVAKAALPLLFEQMKARGFSRVFVDIAPDNAASLALHRALGFAETGQSPQGIRMEKSL